MQPLLETSKNLLDHEELNVKLLGEKHLGEKHLGEKHLGEMCFL